MQHAPAPAPAPHDAAAPAAAFRTALARATTRAEVVHALDELDESPLPRAVQLALARAALRRTPSSREGYGVDAALTAFIAAHASAPRRGLAGLAGLAALAALACSDGKPPAPVEAPPLGDARIDATVDAGVNPGVNPGVTAVDAGVTAPAREQAPGLDGKGGGVAPPAPFPKRKD